MANDDQLRQVATQVYGEDATFYTASDSPYLQGTEIVQFSQLLNYMNVKVRSNTSPVLSLSGSSQGWQATGESFHPFSDDYSPQNFGTLKAKIIPVYSPGRDPALGSTGESMFITFVTSGTQGFIPDGSSRSRSNLEVKDRFETLISHYMESRDLGQTEIYDDGIAFCEPDEFRDGIATVSTDPEKLVIPTALTHASNGTSAFDGVIEVMSIRDVIDLSSTELPNITKSVKGSLTVSDEKRRSYEFSDTQDLRQYTTHGGTSPYLDSVGEFGAGGLLLDRPGPYSDSPENFAAFTDTDDALGAYAGSAIDSEFIDLFALDLIDDTVKQSAPDTSYFPTYLVAARHGFTFSQNDNFGYDSIAFGGLKK